MTLNSSHSSSPSALYATLRPFSNRFAFPGPRPFFVVEATSPLDPVELPGVPYCAGAGLLLVREACLEVVPTGDAAGAWLAGLGADAVELLCTLRRGGRAVAGAEAEEVDPARREAEEMAAAGVWEDEGGGEWCVWRARRTSKWPITVSRVLRQEREETCWMSASLRTRDTWS